MYRSKQNQKSASSSTNLTAANDLIHRKCARCEEEENKLQRKENNGNSVSTAPSIVSDVLSSGGRSLDTDTRSFMESRFNYDFSSVKIHDNDVAAKSADSISALAYTSGNSIVFNSGQYNTNSDSGKRLLAHELTHVMQQEDSHDTNSIVQRDDCETRDWPNGCSAEGGCEAGKKCGDMKDWSKCACWDTAAEQRMRDTVPGWVLYLLAGAATLALIACFATGVCELGIILAGLGAATAAVLITILREFGLIGSSESPVAANDESEADYDSSADEYT